MEGLAFYSEIFVIYILSFLFEFLYLPFNSLNPKKFNPLLFSTWKLFLQPAILKILSPPNDFQHNHLLLFLFFYLYVWCEQNISSTDFPPSNIPELLYNIFIACWFAFIIDCIFIYSQI